MAGAGEVARSLFALPSNAGGWTAFAVGVLLIALPEAKRAACFAWLTCIPRWPFVACSAIAAATLSALYVRYFLGGAPRIIDATTYLFEARLIAQGKFAFAFDGPLSSYNGRFLVVTPDLQLAPIFPPGYPALLALGVLFEHPMWIGPLLAALLVLAVYHVGLALFEAEAPARMAVLFSVFSAAQRYHSADTMSHALCALLFLGALYGVSRHCWRAWLLAGFCLGWLVATRPATALAAGVCCVVLVAARSAAFRATASDVQSAGLLLTPRRALGLAMGAIPGVALLLCQQKAVTGHWFESIQYLYYARSDSPEDCFRYGIGSNIGCRFEHGDFLRQYMPQGYDLRAALGTTGRRIAAHLCDAANFEIFTLFLPLIIWLRFRDWGVRVLSSGLVLQLLAYVPFYFDGNYPGGGARMFADVLPLEHLLLGLFFGTPLRAVQTLGVSLLGLALHASSKHLQLKEREGGRPLFETAVLQSVPAPDPARPRLLYINSDHGFNLATLSDPAWRVARYRGDQSDWDVYQALGKPDSYRYLFWVNGESEPRLEAYVPAESQRSAAADFWPLSAVTAGSVMPIDSTCFIGTRALTLEATSLTAAAPHSADRSMSARLDLWLPHAGSYAVSVIGRGQFALSNAVSDAYAFSEQLRSRQAQASRTQLPAGPDSAQCMSLKYLLQVKAGGLVPLWVNVTGSAELSAVELAAEFSPP